MRVTSFGTLVGLSERDARMFSRQEAGNLARDILEGQGYRVLVAQNGEEAIAICRAESQPIDLMLTDVVMPGMNGQELAKTVRGLRPKMQILYTSGYTDEAIIHHGVLEPVNFCH